MLHLNSTMGLLNLGITGQSGAVGEVSGVGDTARPEENSSQLHSGQLAESHLEEAMPSGCQVKNPGERACFFVSKRDYENSWEGN